MYVFQQVCSQLFFGIFSNDCWKVKEAVAGIEFKAHILANILHIILYLMHLILSRTVAGAYPSSHWKKAGWLPGQAGSLLHGVMGPNNHLHSHRVLKTNQFSVDLIFMLLEAGEAGENQREHAWTPHREGPRQRIKPTTLLSLKQQHKPPPHHCVAILTQT